jgi:hypothetical protein
MIKSGRKGWTGYVALVGEKRICKQGFIVKIRKLSLLRGNTVVK